MTEVWLLERCLAPYEQTQVMAVAESKDQAQDLMAELCAWEFERDNGSTYFPFSDYEFEIRAAPVGRVLEGWWDGIARVDRNSTPE